MSICEPTPHALRTGEIITVRSAVPTEASAVLGLVSSVLSSSDHTVTQPDEFCRTVEEQVEWIRQRAESPGRLCLVAACQDALVGLLNVEADSRRRIAHCARLALSIREGWRGKGIGTLLLEACLDWGRRHPHVEKLTLAVFANNAAALALYRKLGFTEEARLRRGIKLGPGEYVDDVLMCRWVK